MKTIICFSGGLDSTVLLAALRAEKHEVKCLSVNYGQRHVKELEAAKMITSYYGIEHRVADLSSLKPLLAGSSQTSDSMPVPEGHYTAENMKQTVVPNRNMLLLAVAGAWAASLKYNNVAYAAHGGDHAIYPDCRPEFTEAMRDALRICDWQPIKLLRPFLFPKPLSKGEVVKIGFDLGAPLISTWSCYKGEELHCGKCGTCVERKEAFQQAGVSDPTHYKE